MSETYHGHIVCTKPDVAIKQMNCAEEEIHVDCLVSVQDADDFCGRNLLASKDVLLVDLQPARARS